MRKEDLKIGDAVWLFDEYGSLRRGVVDDTEPVLRIDLTQPHFFGSDVITKKPDDVFKSCDEAASSRISILEDEVGDIENRIDDLKAEESDLARQLSQVRSYIESQKKEIRERESKLAMYQDMLGEDSHD